MSPCLRSAKGLKSFVDSQRQHRGVTNKPMHVRIWKSGFDRQEAKVTIFSLRGGKRTFYTSSVDLGQAESHHPILELAGSVNWNYADRNLYVVELNPKVFDRERRFFEANLHWIPGKHSVYVGVTGLTPEQRFRAHLRGEHAAWFV
jgi:hypothetical protein